MQLAGYKRWNEEPLDNWTASTIEKDGSYTLGDWLDIDLGDTILEGYYAGVERRKIGDTVRWYIKLARLNSRATRLKVFDRIPIADYPDMRIKRLVGV